MFSKILLALACAGTSAYYGRQGRHMMQMEGDNSGYDTGYAAAPAYATGTDTGYEAKEVSYATAPAPTPAPVAYVTAPAYEPATGYTKETGYGATYTAPEQPAYQQATGTTGYGTADLGQAQGSGYSGYGATPEPVDNKKPMLLIGLIVAASIALILLIIIVVLCIVGYRCCSSNSSFLFLQMDQMLK